MCVSTHLVYEYEDCWSRLAWRSHESRLCKSDWNTPEDIEMHFDMVIFVLHPNGLDFLVLFSFAFASISYFSSDIFDTVNSKITISYA